MKLTTDTHYYSLRGSRDTDDISKVMGSEVKVKTFSSGGKPINGLTSKNMYTVYSSGLAVLYLGHSK